MFSGKNSVGFSCKKRAQGKFIKKLIRYKDGHFLANDFFAYDFNVRTLAGEGSNSRAYKFYGISRNFSEVTELKKKQ